MNSMHSNGRNVFITGASGGIGKALVNSFSHKGYNIWACIRRKNEIFEKYCEDLSEECGVWIRVVYADLSISESRRNCIKDAIQEEKSLDVLINCAGIGHMGLFQMTSSESIKEIYEVNVFAVMDLCQYAVRIMSKQKRGIIINISSTASNETYVGNCIYGATKASVNAFTKSLAAEVATLGIQVNAIAPGLTDTEMSRVFEGNDKLLPLERSAIGRKLLPSEIADVAVTLCDDSMKMVNGQVIVVNGGSK